jgi:hypothetical protein
MHKRPFTRVATVSPPRFGEPNAVRRKPRTIRRPCNGRTGAATVSPPWLRTASATAIAHTPAAIDCYTRAGGRQPPWVQETHLQLVAKVAGWLLATVSPPWVRSVERSAWRAVNHLQSRFGNHGWLTPAAPGARRSFAGKSFLAMRSRTGTKSGGRKPPVAQNRIGNRNRPHTRPTEQPSVGSENALATSGEGCRMAAGERSPPWVGRWRVLRSVPRINVQLRLGNHGRLTPAAPAARRSFAGK